MNCIFLSPHFPLHYHLFCKHLKDMGVKTLGIDMIPYDHLLPEVRSSLTDYYQVDDLRDFPAVAKACRHYLNKYGTLDWVESHNEFWLELQADLRSHFNIPGLQASQIHEIKRKSEMKKIYKKAGMRVADGELVTDLQAALKFIEKVGYPVIAKPDTGVGAEGCHKIHNELELFMFFEDKPHADYLMEEFIHGSLCSFDGLTNQQGKIIYHTVHMYNIGVEELRRHKGEGFYYSLIDIPPELEDIGRKTVAAFPVKASFFHLEFFKTKDGYIPLEVNIRPPGAFIFDMCNFASDIDLYKQWCEVLLNNPSEMNHQKKYHCAGIHRRYIYPYAFTHEEILARWGDRIVIHEPINPLSQIIDGDYGYVARSSSMEELYSIIEFIQEKQPEMVEVSHSADY